MDTREAILQSALKLFCARGYDAVGVQEIVDHAGTTKPSLYYYFGSKQGLLQEILQVNIQELETALTEAVRVSEDVSAVLYRVAQTYFTFAGTHWQFYRFMMSQFYGGRETEGFQAVHPLIQRYYKLIVGIFEEASPRLGNMRGRQQQFAVSFMGTLDSHMMMQARIHDEEETISIPDEQVYEIVKQYLYGIYT